jgi:hypothetical protein
MIVLLDGCPPAYPELFRKYFTARDLEFVVLDGVGNRTTFLQQIDQLERQDYSEYIYFAEDDYLYLPGQFPSMFRFMSAHKEVDFATPYDHLDYYTMPIHKHATRAIAFEGRKWRTVGSTTLTFLTSRTVLRQTREVFETYARHRGNTDFGLWFTLTKFRVRSPATLVRGLTGQPVQLAVMAFAWYYGWRQVLFGTRRELWAPAPTIAAHMDSRFLPPGFDWQAILAESVKFPD